MKKKPLTFALLTYLVLIGLFTYRYYQNAQIQQRSAEITLEEQEANIMGINIGESSLVGYWKFDEGDYTALDSSTGNNHGILENGASHIVDSQKGNNLLLGGGDDRVLIPTSGAINNMESLSATAWINPAEGGIIIRKGNSSLERFSIGINSKRRLYLRSGFSKQPGLWLTNESLALNQWSHIAITYSFSSISNDPVLYINGAQRPITEHQAPEGNDMADTSYMYLGNNHDLINRTQDPGINSAFTGKMDLIRIYNRSLSASEIQTIYDPSTPTPTPKPSQNPQLPNNQNTKTEATESSPEPTTAPTGKIENDTKTTSINNIDTQHPNSTWSIISKLWQQIKNIFRNNS